MKNNIDWEQRLFIASTAALVGNLSSPELLQVVTSKEVVGDSFAERNAKSCVKFAKALIKELKQENDALQNDTDFAFTSHKQFLKLTAINKLLNVAKHLNGDWKPHWSEGGANADAKYSICINRVGDVTLYICNKETNANIVYFHTESDALRAINILGVDTIKLALSTDY